MTSCNQLLGRISLLVAVAPLGLVVDTVHAQQRTRAREARAIEPPVTNFNVESIKQPPQVMPAAMGEVTGPVGPVYDDGPRWYYPKQSRRHPWACPPLLMARPFGAAFRGTM